MKFEVDPGLATQYADQRAQVRKGFNNPLGAYYNPQVKESMQRASDERLGQEEAQAFRGGQFDVNRLNYSKQAALAGMTAPQLTQTGSSSSGTGTINQSTNPTGSILSAGAALAPLSM